MRRSRFSRTRAGRGSWTRGRRMWMTRAHAPIGAGCPITMWISSSMSTFCRRSARGMGSDPLRLRHLPQLKTTIRGGCLLMARYGGVDFGPEERWVRTSIVHPMYFLCTRFIRAQSTGGGVNRVFPPQRLAWPAPKTDTAAQKLVYAALIIF